MRLMTGEIVVPPLGESIIEATVARWIKQTCDYVQADEPILELETGSAAFKVDLLLSKRLCRNLLLKLHPNSLYFHSHAIF